jgi:flavin-dependent dehydrogenase
VSYGIRRCEFDHYLLHRCGARLKVGEPVQSIARDGGVWVINDRYRTPMLVGAGGHFCPVARQLAGDQPVRPPVVAAQEVEFALDADGPTRCPVEGHRPELYFCRDLTGYGWCFRKGPYLNVGMGRVGCRRIRDHVAEFCAYLEQQGRIPPRLPGRLHGHAYLLYGHSPRAAAQDHVLLVGDALGLAYMESGEGILPAIESGLLAADVIVAAKQDYSSSRLARYRTLLETRFGRRPLRAPAGLIPSRLHQFLGACLLTNRWFVRHLVVERWLLHGQ